MILQSQSFNINEFKIPSFKLMKGEMARLWVQIVPISENESNGYWGANKMKEAISKLNSGQASIKLCPNRIKRKLKDYFKPQTVGKYLDQNFRLTDKEIKKLISQFEIKPDYLVKDLGTAHSKILSIICEFQNNTIVVFDYYGLSPRTEEQLTLFVKNELKKGKSAISFDNLYYKPENPDSEMIKNVEVLRIKTSKEN